MDLQQLKYFCTIVENGQISIAAAKLHITQPPLTRQLKLLEEELNVDLFIRNGRNLILTDVGYMLYKKAKDILRSVEDTEHDVMLMHRRKINTLHLGCIDSLSSYVFRTFLHKYSGNNTHVCFDFYTGDNEDIVEKLTDQSIEIGIVHSPFYQEDIYSSKILKDPMIAVIPQAISAHTGDITMQNLANYPLLIHKNYQSFLENSLKKHHTPTHHIHITNDFSLSYDWVKYNLGIVICPKSSFVNKNIHHVSYCNIIDDDIPSIESYIIWSKKHHLSQTAENFLSLINNCKSNAPL